MSEDRQQTNRATAASYAGMGLEFAAAVGVFCLIGWWIDRRWKIEGHWGVLICSLLGLIGGMYNFIRQAIAASRDMGRPHSSRRPDSRNGSADHGASPPDA